MIVAILPEDSRTSVSYAKQSVVIVTNKHVIYMYILLRLYTYITQEFLTDL